LFHIHNNVSMLWKPIKDYENYQVSDCGDVMNSKGKILKFQKTKDGYLQVNLWKNSQNKTFNVHRLVAETFIPNLQNKPQVDHIDRNTTNNNILNLRWVTSSENCENRGMRCDNKTGHKYISYHIRDKLYVFIKVTKGKRIAKGFKTLEQAIKFKEDYLRALVY
jgi:hypothetical protein